MKTKKVTTKPTKEAIDLTVALAIVALRALARRFDPAMPPLTTKERRILQRAGVLEEHGEEMLTNIQAKRRPKPRPRPNWLEMPAGCPAK